jgi:hypothetical protein
LPAAARHLLSLSPALVGVAPFLDACLNGRSYSLPALLGAGRIVWRLAAPFHALREGLIGLLRAFLVRQTGGGTIGEDPSRLLPAAPLARHRRNLFATGKAALEECLAFGRTLFFGAAGLDAARHEVLGRTGATIFAARRRGRWIVAAAGAFSHTIAQRSLEPLLTDLGITSLVAALPQCLFGFLATDTSAPLRRRAVIAALKTLGQKLVPKRFALFARATLSATRLEGRVRSLLAVSLASFPALRRITGSLRIALVACAQLAPFHELRRNRRAIDIGISRRLAARMHFVRELLAALRIQHDITLRPRPARQAQTQ